jgi:Lysine-specific metallo-endopeptidase
MVFWRQPCLWGSGVDHEAAGLLVLFMCKCLVAALVSRNFISTVFNMRIENQNQLHSPSLSPGCFSLPDNGHSNRKEYTMGFIIDELGPHDQIILTRLEPEVIAVLRKASTLTQSGQCKKQSKLWFGDNSDTWMKSLGQSLYQLASMLNTKPIKIVGTHYKKRKTTTSAAAQPPAQGWQPYTKMTGPDQGFTIRLDIAWNEKPLFRPGDTPALSKFHTIVHEMTHLILNTDDVSPAYGESNCKDKAATNPTKAKKNADNWAFFVDDMRKPDLTPPVAAVTSAEWKEKTARGPLHTRSDDLSQVDTALAAYEGSGIQTNRDTLVTAFNKWYTRNPKERASRNEGGVVDRLKSYVESI